MHRTPFENPGVESNHIEQRTSVWASRNTLFDDVCHLNEKYMNMNQFSLYVKNNESMASHTSFVLSNVAIQTQTVWTPAGPTSSYPDCCSIRILLAPCSWLGIWSTCICLANLKLVAIHHGETPSLPLPLLMQRHILVLWAVALNGRHQTQTMVVRPLLELGWNLRNMRLSTRSSAERRHWACDSWRVSRPVCWKAQIGCGGWIEDETMGGSV